MVYDTVCFMILSEITFVQAPGECETRKLSLKVASVLHPS